MLSFSKGDVKYSFLIFTIYVAKTKVLISYPVIWAFVIGYAKSRFS